MRTNGALVRVSRDKSAVWKAGKFSDTTFNAYTQLCPLDLAVTIELKLQEWQRSGITDESLQGLYHRIFSIYRDSR